MKITNKKFSSFWKKCLCLFSILIPCVALTANGQESFKPMLKDGRVWNCIEVYIGEEKNDTVNREYRIKGASEIDGHVCYNLCLGSKPMGIYYEEGPKVFHYTANGWELLFDFSLSPGETAPCLGNLMVNKEETVVMKGESRRCLYFPLTTEDGTELCWIEGIGSSLHGPYYNNIVIGSLLSTKLLSVFDGDVCIFECDDFKPNTGGTSFTNILPKTLLGRSVYDLSGRKMVNDKLPRGIYIEGGKKKVKK